ncbi:hypothetical protein [Geodermatophilus telluris]|uniref:hypothetical protein n=1 Tax=Geodermatophilus telluris TaxID=1190417 RepID=UPI0011137F79|nr:hypothetical protein [Geodermatophilus telluris]
MSRLAAVAALAHPLVQRLLPEGGAPPPMVVLTGLVGVIDTDPERIRLYYDHTLQDWLEIPVRLVRHVEETPSTDGCPWGQDVVWLLHEAPGGEADVARDAAGSTEAGSDETGVIPDVVPRGPGHFTLDQYMRRPVGGLGVAPRPKPTPPPPPG